MSWNTKTTEQAKSKIRSEVDDLLDGRI
jgi:hypothetical protein